MKPATRCLLVYPEFRSESFWNYRATCSLVGARYPAAPLGMITVAALLPESWDLRLVDRNVEELTDTDIEWADIVFAGGMISQQAALIDLIELIRERGKPIVVGGPDATSSPHLYHRATYLALGEAEITLPRWLADFESGTLRHVYEAGEELADVTGSPIPRFDLLKFNRYLHVGVQYARGCPFRCEFCDIIELFGRVPRVKGTDQMLAELDRLHGLGYRGHVDFVDDNFIGNQKALTSSFLPDLKTWLEGKRWPFEFSTEASINISDNETLLEMMQSVGFSAIFVGIESPDEDTLKATQKLQNTKRSIADSVRKIYSYGIFVNCGYIVGFDTEHDGVADGILHLIEASAVPVNMVGMLFALPNTQLQKRLAKEGRLSDGFELAPDGAGDQGASGLNFETLRPRVDILRDYRRVIDESFAPDAYFERVLDVGSALDCSQKKLRLPLRYVLRDMRGLFTLLFRMGITKSYRGRFWRTLGKLLRRNPKGLRYSIAMMALYLHFGEFRHYLITRLSDEIGRQENTAVAAPREEAASV
ncbi:MAG: B12-binding domain-containing radical SAM protein [Planctomycetes bacterium]|nr:B12-binding domain-containing radical SAM protein [Planctomycetota bacterium]